MSYNLSMTKQNFFPTLNEALDSEQANGVSLIETWPLNKPGIAYGETFGYTYDDGSKYGYYVSIYRNEVGMYERPIHYKR